MNKDNVNDFFLICRWESAPFKNFYDSKQYKYCVKYKLIVMRLSLKLQARQRQRGTSGEEIVHANMQEFVCEIRRNNINNNKYRCWLYVV